MLDIINLKDYFLLFIAFIFTVMLPGWALTRLILPPAQLRKTLSNFPRLEGSLIYRYFYWLFAPAVGLVMIDAVVLMLSKFGQPLNFSNYFLSFSVLNTVLLLLNILFIKQVKTRTGNEEKRLKVYALIFMAVFLGSVLIRIIFYIPDAVPGSTDLGHHMYWSQWMVQKETFPNYDTPEVIEGEHMIFAVLSKLSGITLLSAMPLIVLSFYNLAMLLALYFGSMVITANRKTALWVLFFSGIYFAVDPPQARYIKGGVIGNTFGNLIIPLVFMLVFLFFCYFFKYLINGNKDSDSRLYKPVSSLIALILVLIAGSFYSHHLSTFLLGITLAVSFIVWIIAMLISSKGAGKTLIDFFRRIFISLKLILATLLVLIFPLFVYAPHYLANNAVETVTQEPEKDTHLGVTFEDFLGKMGWTRFFLLTLALAYLAVVLLASIGNRYNLIDKLSSLKILKVVNKIKLESKLNLFLLFLGWFLPLALLSFYPGIFKIDLPSRRVVNYLVFPSIILAAVAANFILPYLIKKIRLRPIKWFVFALVLIVLWDGSRDFRSTYININKFQENIELFKTSEYIANNTKEDAVMLKDHSSIPGDAWIKFFLLRGYDSFLSRTYDYKYSDTGSTLDPCTREMIIVPGSNVSKTCYGQTGINYVILKPAGDEYLFWKGKGFDSVYVNDSLAIFKVSKYK